MLKECTNENNQTKSTHKRTYAVIDDLGHAWGRSSIVMVQQMDKNQVVELLRAELANYETQKDLARVIGVTPSFLHDVLRARRDPTGAILDFLELEKVVIYQPKVKQYAKKITSASSAQSRISL